MHAIGKYGMSIMYTMYKLIDKDGGWGFIFIWFANKT